MAILATLTETRMNACSWSFPRWLFKNTLATLTKNRMNRAFQAEKKSKMAKMANIFYAGKFGHLGDDHNRYTVTLSVYTK